MILLLALLHLIHFLPSAAYTTDANLQIDCHPDADASETVCKQRGCLWLPTAVTGAPFCIFRTEPGVMAGYDVTEIRSDPAQVAGKLKRRNTPTLFRGDVDELMFQVQSLSTTHLRIRLTDLLHKRSEVSQLHSTIDAYLKRQEQALLKQAAKVAAESEFEIQVSQQPFGVVIKRKSSGAVLFDSTGIPGLTFAEQFLQISTRLPSRNIYGFGEQVHKQLRHDLNWRKWTFYTRDYAVVDDSQNEYGYHPFYICLENDGNAHGVLFANSHAMDVMLQPDPIVTFRTIGGVIDLHIFIGPKPDHVIQQYSHLIGRPMMPPIWGLGFQLCRYGYRNLSYLESVYNRNRAARIPQDVQYIDLDYSQDWMDFTLDTRRFRNLSQFVQRMKGEFRELVLIVDPGIANRPTINPYPPLERGLELDVFIKDPRTGQPLEGAVWPGTTFYPDFFKPSTTRYWTEMIKEFHKLVNFSGLWIDMNEPSNFGTGSTTACELNQLNFPPYNPLTYKNMSEKTICADAMQFAGNHYALHSMYGFTEARATNLALRRLFPGYRPFVLSRSTFYGSGRFTAHWTGDNQSWWRQLKWSIVTCLEFNFFGIPWVGADICGFGGEAEEQMCVRWHQLGAFYPFSRNHNDRESHREQDPAAWSPGATEAIRIALSTRYQYISHLYTLFFYAHVNGSTVMRPLFFEFPQDEATWAIDDQFLWGPYFMVAPIVEQSADYNYAVRQIYFPRGRWYHALTYEEMPLSNTGRTLNVTVSINETAIYLRGGSVLTHQEALETVRETSDGHYRLQVCLDEKNQANGSLYFDDELSQGSYEGGYYLLLQMVVTENDHYGQLNITQLHNGMFEVDPWSQGIKNITIQGIDYEPTGAQVLDYEPTSQCTVQCVTEKKFCEITFYKPLPLNSAKFPSLIVQWSKPLEF